MNFLNGLSRLLREFLLALQFFTRIPVTGRLADWVGFSPGLLRASAAHFPAVGALVGAVAALVFGVVQASLPVNVFAPLIAAALSTIATAMLTGAFHEDGLADLADGLGGSQDADRALEIMKDSRVGAFGALALVMALLTKVSLLALLGSMEDAATRIDIDTGIDITADSSVLAWYFDGAYACAALFVGHVVSRGLPLLLIRYLPHLAGSGASKSKPLADHISTPRLLIGLGWCAAALALGMAVLEPGSLLIASGFALVALLYMARLLRRRLQGFTGDGLGAAQQVCEIAFYLGLAVSL
jgi:adenosylcobinamide-GDP ribazoletransferase